MTSRPTGSVWTPPRGSSTWSAPTAPATSPLSARNSRRAASRYRCGPRAPPTSPILPAASVVEAMRWPPASPPSATRPPPSTRSPRPWPPSAPPRVTGAGPPPVTGAGPPRGRGPSQPGWPRARLPPEPPEGERTGHGWRARLRQAARGDLARRGRQGPAAGAPAARGARRHARPARHRRAGGGPRPGHQAATVPADGAQAVPGRDHLRRRDRHARRDRRPHRHRAGRRHRRGGGRARPVTIHALELRGFQSGPPPLATVAVTCSGGTYVRVLAADLGRALGSAAHLASLRRTAVGAFGEREARTLAELEGLPNLEPALIDPAAAMRSVSVRTLSEGEAAALASGQTLGPTGVGDPVAAVGPDGRLVAVIQDGAGRARPKVVLG